MTLPDDGKMRLREWVMSIIVGVWLVYVLAHAFSMGPP